MMLLALALTSATAQKKSKIKLLRADNLLYDKNLGADVQRIIGNAVFKHKKTLLYCDSAYLYGNSNSVKAYGHVHINDNDSVHIYSDSLNYSGNTRMAELYDNIRMTDPTMTLTTNHLKYNLKKKIGALRRPLTIYRSSEEIQCVPFLSPLFSLPCR